MIWDVMEGWIRNLMFLVGFLLYRVVVFLGGTIVSIGFSVIFSRCYFYLLGAKIPLAVQTSIALVFVIIFSFVWDPYGSGLARKRMRKSPLTLVVIPHVIYIFTFLYSFYQVFTRYTKTAVEDRNNAVAEWRTEISWNNGYFFVNLLYIVYTTVRVKANDIDKNIAEKRNVSYKEIIGFLVMTATQWWMLCFYLIIVSSGSAFMFVVSLDREEILIGGMMSACMIGVIAANVDLLFWKKNDSIHLHNPFRWFENAIRARFAVLITIFFFFNWSFFEDRNNPKLLLPEYRFPMSVVIMGAAIIHVMKIFSIIMIKWARKFRSDVASAYRRSLAEDMDMEDHANLAKDDELVQMEMREGQGAPTVPLMPQNSTELNLDSIAREIQMQQGESPLLN